MESEQFTPHVDLPDSASTVAAYDGDHRHLSADTGRRKCGRCDRPLSVCLCSSIPAEPIPTRTQVVILHHPHEQRHKLATVPVLSKCLQNCQTLVGRRLRRGDSPLLDYLHDAAVENPSQSLRAAFLFPGTNTLRSMEINQWKSSFHDEGFSNYILIAFDGTWKHAKEMVQASLPFLSKFCTQVCLAYDPRVDGGTIFNSDLILRKEPFSGCMSTMEVIARCLRVLEPSGVEIESRLVEVLRAMVGFQASFLKPMKPRSKLLKKGNNKSGGDERTVFSG
ncbi:hypothetical protein RJ639_011413 [Escallonia herrerae]|uniref:tRNA-uridine aminocarboxypropyltransferase n=1 Tax=Escallonia herrerae TaxID=1293975 RepID=A0AA89AQ88_9ASTE|nr:hypothetical protein RJ639_011413 [Escallonia herrerae]